MAECRAISMNAYMAMVSPYLGPACVNRDAWCRIRAVASLLPPCSLAGFELRLNDEQTHVDFFVRLPYVNPGLPPSLLNHPVWQTVQRVCDAVADESGPLHDGVRHIILEFDLDHPPVAVPIPALFLELNPDSPFNAPQLLGITESLGLHNRASTSQTAIDCCIRALPSGAKPAHLGFMLSRPGQPARVVIQGMPTTAVAGYLDSLGWQDPTRQLSALIADIAPIADPEGILDIDVAEAVRPKIGVEFYLRLEADNPPRWKALFSFLVERGLAGAAKTKALLEWPGCTQEAPDNHEWPANLAPGDVLFRGLAKSIFWRNLNHIKLGYQPGQEPEIKVYLGFGHNWFRTGTVATT